MPGNFSEGDNVALKNAAENACADHAAWYNEHPDILSEKMEPADARTLLKGWRTVVYAQPTETIYAQCGDNTAGCWKARAGTHTIRIRDYARGRNGGVRVMYHEVHHALFFLAGLPVNEHHNYMKALGWY